MVKAPVFLPFAGVLATKDGLRDEAVLLQLRQVESMMDSEEASPHELSALLEKHALAMVDGGAPSYTDDATLEGMQKTMDALITNIKNDIDASQEKINEARNKVVDQYEVTINGEGGLDEVRSTEQEAHHTCRAGEDEALHEEKKECNRVEEHWTGAPQPECPAADIKDLISSHMWAEGWGGVLDGLVKTCKAKRLVARKYTTPVEGYDCNGMQRDFETAWCEQKAGHQKGCDDIKAQQQTYIEQLARFKKHSHMIQGAKKVNCFVGVIMDGKGQQLNGDKVKACVDLTYFQTPETEEETVNTHTITVDYDDGDKLSLELPSPEQTCDTLWTDEVSGSDTWKQSTGYSSKKESIQDRYLTIHKCGVDLTTIDAVAERQELVTGPGWHLVFRQTYPTLFNQEEWSKNPNDPTAANFAILDQLDQFKVDGKFKFKMSWPGSGDQANIWTQTSHPVQTSGVANYVPVDVAYPGNGWFNGLAKNYGGQANALLDGDKGGGDWYSIGMYQEQSAGIWAGHFGISSTDIGIKGTIAPFSGEPVVELHAWK